jgi:hypothetical protein
MRRARLALLGAPIVAFFAACSTSSPPPDDKSSGGCVAFVSAADLHTPTVSFIRDVMPILEKSCATGGATCHGDPSVVSDAVPRPFLGADVAKVRGGLVHVRSREDLAMDLVAPGDPAHSFLMHKVDGDQCTLMAECAVGNSIRPNCGAFMPYQSPTVLDVQIRDTLRRWIAQGAGDN